MAAAAALECILRLASWAVPRPSLTSPAGARVILCEGDSWTWGVGGRSYPLALQGLLDARFGRGVFETVNAGIPGRDSTRVLHDLPGHLDALRPEAVLLLVGANDWSLNGLTGASPSLLQRAVPSFMTRTRLYALARLWLVPRREASARAACGDEPELPDSQAIPALRQCLHDRPNDPGVRLALGWRLERSGDRAKALEVWRPGLEGPAAKEFYLEMGDALNVSGDLEGALDLWRRGFERPQYRTLIAPTMAEALADRGRHAEALAVLKEALLEGPRSSLLRLLAADELESLGRAREAGAQRRLASAGDEPMKVEARARRLASAGGDPRRFAASEGRPASAVEIGARLESNIVEIVELSRAAGAKVVVADYPWRPTGAAARAARRAGAVYLDLGALFAARFAGHREWVGFDGGHCNTRGYAAMAEMFAEALGTAGLAPLPPR